MLKIRFDLSKNPFQIHLIIISVYPPKPLNQRSYFFYLVFQQTLFITDKIIIQKSNLSVDYQLNMFLKF